MYKDPEWPSGLGPGSRGRNHGVQSKIYASSSIPELFWIALHRGAVLCTLALYNASPSTNRPGGNFLEVRGLRRPYLGFNEIVEIQYEFTYIREWR